MGRGCPLPLLQRLSQSVISLQSFLPALPGQALGGHPLLLQGSLQRRCLINYLWPSFCFCLASVEEGLGVQPWVSFSFPPPPPPPGIR